MDTNDNTDLKSTLVLDLCQGILESPDPNHADTLAKDLIGEVEP